MDCLTEDQLLYWKQECHLRCFDVLYNKESSILQINWELVIIPGGIAFQLQFLDVATDKPFEHWSCLLFWEWLLFENCPVTLAGNIRWPSEALLGLCIKSACNNIYPEFFVQVFEKCCWSKCVNRTNYVLWEGDHEENSSSNNERVGSGQVTKWYVFACMQLFTPLILIIFNSDDYVIVQYEACIR